MQNKGGRPKKGAAQKKSYRINIKMATAEYYMLKSKASKGGMTISAYLREVIASSIVSQRLTPAHQNLIRQLCGMANNLNQIARKANAQGYNKAREEYLFLADKIDQLIDSM